MSAQAEHLTEHPVALTVFSADRWRASKPQGVLVEETFGGLVRWARHPIVSPAKDENGGVSFARFEESLRALDRVISVSALALDVDKGNVPPAELHAALEMFAHLVFTTHSDAPGARRSRVVLPFDRPASRAEYEQIWPASAHIFTAAGVPLDMSTRDASRFWFAPAVKPGASFESYVGEGELLSVGRLLEVAKATAPKPAPLPQRSARDLPRSGVALVDRASAYVARMPPAISGQGGHRATFNVARKLVADFGLSDSDAWAVLLEHNARCSPRWSERELLHKLRSARERARVSNPVQGIA